MAGKLKWWEAAEIIGVTDRTMRRWRKQYEEHGYSGLWDYRKRSPSPKRVPVADLEKVLRLFREQYFDLNVQHFHEKLRDQHGLEYSYMWVKTALQEAGLVERRKKPGSHRKRRPRRPRRPLPGMMLHIDGSEHRWFKDDRYYELLVIMDDATSEIYSLKYRRADQPLRIEVGVVSREDDWLFRIQDNGVGFRQETYPVNSSLPTISLHGTVLCQRAGQVASE